MDYFKTVFKSLKLMATKGKEKYEIPAVIFYISNSAGNSKFENTFKINVKLS